MNNNKDNDVEFTSFDLKLKDSKYKRWTPNMDQFLIKLLSNIVHSFRKDEVPEMNKRAWSYVCNELRLANPETVYSTYTKYSCQQHLYHVIHTRYKMWYLLLMHSKNNMNNNTGYSYKWNPNLGSFQIIAENENQVIVDTNIIKSIMYSNRLSLPSVNNFHKGNIVINDFFLSNNFQYLSDYHNEILPMMIKLDPKYAKGLENVYNDIPKFDFEGFKRPYQVPLQIKRVKNKTKDKDNKKSKIEIDEDNSPSAKRKKTTDTNNGKSSENQSLPQSTTLIDQSTNLPSDLSVSSTPLQVPRMNSDVDALSYYQNLQPQIRHSLNQPHHQSQSHPQPQSQIHQTQTIQPPQGYPQHVLQHQPLHQQSTTHQLITQQQQLAQQQLYQQQYLHQQQMSLQQLNQPQLNQHHHQASQLQLHAPTRHSSHSSQPQQQQNQQQLSISQEYSTIPESHEDLTPNLAINAMTTPITSNISQNSFNPNIENYAKDRKWFNKLISLHEHSLLTIGEVLTICEGVRDNKIPPAMLNILDPGYNRDDHESMSELKDEEMARRVRDYMIPMTYMRSQ